MFFRNSSFVRVPKTYFIPQVSLISCVKLKVDQCRAHIPYTNQNATNYSSLPNIAHSEKFLFFTESEKKLSIENNLPFLTSEYESKFMREIIFSLDEK